MLLKFVAIALEQYCVFYFEFVHIHRKNYIKLVWSQFEVNETCIEFFISNFLAQSNSFKRKLKLKVEKIRIDFSFIFCEINVIAADLYSTLPEA